MQIHLREITKKTNIIDIRTTVEFNDFNYPGSKNVPRLFLLQNPEKFLDKNNDYYLICQKGEVSLACSKILNALGYRCYSIIGGIESYKTTLGR